MMQDWGALRAVVSSILTSCGKKMKSPFLAVGGGGLLARRMSERQARMQ